MKTKTLFFILVLCSFTVIVNAQLAGNTFQLDMGEQGKFNLKFMENKYELSNEQGDMLAFGDYTVEENMLTFRDKGGPQSCPSGTVGKYKFKIENQQLVLELIEDDCDGRPSMASAKWKQIEN